jgi:cation diffusion facilitator CzcD-associated flavoprotein CzcO
LLENIDTSGSGHCANISNRYLLEEKYFEQIDVFEQRSSVGGAWNYSPSSTKVGLTATVPHVNPHEPVEKPSWTRQPGGNSEAVFVSPLYDRLETNIPKELMRFADKPFPAEAQLFPKHKSVKQYLEEYAEEVKTLIQFETQVVNVKLRDPELSTWDLTTANLHTSVETTRTYDAVVVASGHFTVPYLPDIQGIETWDKTYPGIISHSKFYDTPETFRDKKVVVVGNSASGLDIGAQINQVSKGNILVSQRSESYLAASAPGDKIICPEIVEFLSPGTHNRAIRFADGRVEDEIDAVVFCTGYFYSYPFLSSLNPAVVTHGWRTRNVYQQLFYIDHPTLVFPVLSQRVIPFPIAENQAAVFARVWSARLKLPSKDDMHTAEEVEVKTKGDGKAFHLMPFPMDADYLNFLYNWAAKAEQRPALDHDGQGKIGTYWGERERWMRAHFPDIRRAFVQKGAQRSEIRTLVEVGFDFDQWKHDQEEEKRQEEA